MDQCLYYLNMLICFESETPFKHNGVFLWKKVLRSPPVSLLCWCSHFCVLTYRFLLYFIFLKDFILFFNYVCMLVLHVSVCMWLQVTAEVRRGCHTGAGVIEIWELPDIHS